MMASANKTGQIAETIIAAILQQNQCEFSRQCPVGQSIYGTTLRADFVVHNFDDYPNGLAIEAKWQNVGGSADEKFPYIVANARAGRYARPLMVVAFGPGLRSGALNWVRSQVDTVWLVGVFDLEGLMSWLQRRACGARGLKPA